MQQELLAETDEAATAQQERKDRTRFEAAITDPDKLTVELTRRTETLTAEKIRENGETRTVIDLDEDTDTTTFTLSTPDDVYRAVLPDPWEVLAEALAPTTAAIPADWDVPRAPQPPTDPVQVEASDPVQTVERPFHQNPFRPTPAEEKTETRTGEHIEEYRPELVATHSLEPASRPPYAHTSVLEEPDGATPTISPDRAQPMFDRLEQEAERQDGLLATIRRENVLKAVYDPEENENGTSRRLLYAVEEEATVRETLLDLVERGIVNATITRQPFYSPEPFEKDGQIVEGWTDAYAVVALDGMPIQMTEFSYGSDTLELAEDDIASVTVEPGDMVDFAAAEVYTCGTDQETTAASRAAWEDHDTYRWFDDDWKRSIYAALAAGYRFEGSPLDLSHAPQVREAYIDAFNHAPEDALDNVVYKG